MIQTLREWLLRMATSRLAHKRRQLQLIRHAEPEAYQNAHDAMRSSSMRQGRLSDRLGRELTVTTAALAPADLGHSEQPPTAAKQGNAAADATDADPATEADTGAVSAPADALTTVMVELDRLRMGCGHLQQHLGALSHAKALFEQSLQAREKAYGTVDDLVAECLEALADIERLQGHFAAAEGLLTRALKIQQEVLLRSFLRSFLSSFLRLFLSAAAKLSGRARSLPPRTPARPRSISLSSFSPQCTSLSLTLSLLIPFFLCVSLCLSRSLSVCLAASAAHAGIFLPSPVPSHVLV